MDWYLRGECGVVLVHDTRSNDFRSINARLMYKLPFFPFHEQKGARETAYFASETLLDNSNSISVKQKAGKLHVISFQQCSSRFAARTVLFAIHSQIFVCIVLECCEKCIYDVRLNLHIFVHVVSEVALKKFENVLKSYQN